MEQQKNVINYSFQESQVFFRSLATWKKLGLFFFWLTENWQKNIVAFSKASTFFSLETVDLMLKIKP
jgi:hypothetical protein